MFFSIHYRPIPIGRSVGFFCQPGRERPPLKGAYVIPRTSLEQTLASIFCDVLNLDAVGVHDDFFDLGGDSLKATRLASLVETTLAAPVSSAFFFESLSLAQLAKDLSEKTEVPTLLPLRVGKV